MLFVNTCLVEGYIDACVKNFTVTLETQEIILYSPRSTAWLHGHAGRVADRSLVPSVVATAGTLSARSPILPTGQGSPFSYIFVSLQQLRSPVYNASKIECESPPKWSSTNHSPCLISGITLLKQACLYVLDTVSILKQLIYVLFQANWPCI